MRCKVEDNDTIGAQEIRRYGRRRQNSLRSPKAHHGGKTFFHYCAHGFVTLFLILQYSILQYSILQYSNADRKKSPGLQVRLFACGTCRFLRMLETFLKHYGTKKFCSHNTDSTSGVGAKEKENQTRSQSTKTTSHALLLLLCGKSVRIWPLIVKEIPCSG